jgi:hypothetical protein
MDLTRAGPQTLSPDQIANDPGYQFQLQQGQQALQRSAAAKGLLNSGATLKGLDRYSQGLAATQYQNAWDRNQALYANKWNRLGQLSGVGQSSAQNLGGIGTSYANAMSELYGAQGNAQAAGILGMTGGMASATRSAGNMMTMGLGGMMGGGGGMGGMLSGLMGGGK